MSASLSDAAHGESGPLSLVMVLGIWTCPGLLQVGVNGGFCLCWAIVGIPIAYSPGSLGIALGAIIGMVAACQYLQPIQQLGNRAAVHQQLRSWPLVTREARALHADFAGMHARCAQFCEAH